MANKNVVLYNPTGADVTVNAQTVPAHNAKKLVIADTTTDLYAFLAAGCVAGASDRSRVVDELSESGFYFAHQSNQVPYLA